MANEDERAGVRVLREEDRLMQAVLDMQACRLLRRCLPGYPGCPLRVPDPKSSNPESGSDDPCSRWNQALKRCWLGTPNPHGLLMCPHPPTPQQKQHWKTHKPDCQAPRAEPPQDRQFMRSQFANQNATLSPSQRWDLVNQANQRKDYAEVLRCNPPPALG